MLTSTPAFGLAIQLSRWYCRTGNYAGTVEARRASKAGGGNWADGRRKFAAIWMQLVS
jgi:hypothetical protein